MIIDNVLVDSIKPYENNPRKNDEAVPKVIESINKYGYRTPIIVDENMVVLCGHTRLKAIKQLGWATVPFVVQYTDLNEQQKNGYRILDNKTGEYAEWDFDQLLKDFKRDDLFDLGFDFKDLGKDPREDKEDEIPEVKETPKTVLGDIYQLGDHRLICGDSTTSKTYESLMQGNKATMCFTDPPWNVAIGLDSNPRHRQREGLINDKLPQEDFEAFLCGFIDNVKQYLIGDIYCVLGNEQMPTLDYLFRKADFHWSSIIVWVKDIFVLGRSKYHRRYEPIWYGWPEGVSSSYCAGRDQDDVWECKRPKRSDAHPTMKPVELVERAVINSANPGDIVLEPFCGGGSTLIACEKNKRKCYAIELDPKYCDVIVSRYVQFTGNNNIYLNGQAISWTA